MPPPQSPPTPAPGRQTPPWAADWRWPALPGQCPLCGDWSRQPLCMRCQQRFAPPRLRCRRCALPMHPGAAAEASVDCGACLRSPPPWSQAVAVADYGFPWDRLVADLKFNQRTDRAAALSDLLVAAVQALPAHDAPARADPAGQGPIHGLPDAVLPVPLGPHRLAERGYNQAWELARRVARRLHRPAHAHWLQRLRDAPQQVGLTRTQRLANLRHAFWVPPEAEARVRGRVLALVDDVLTTGATASLATEALLQAGAAEVRLWVVARTLPPGDGPRDGTTGELT